MAEFLIVMAQGLCILGLLGGAYLSIAQKRVPQPIAAREGYDSITAHTWQVGHGRGRRG